MDRHSLEDIITRVAHQVTLDAMAPITAQLQATSDSIAPVMSRIDHLEQSLTLQKDQHSQVLAAIHSLSSRLPSYQGPPPTYVPFPAVYPGHPPVHPTAHGQSQDASHYGAASHLDPPTHP